MTTVLLWVGAEVAARLTVVGLSRRPGDGEVGWMELS
jgi:hypothetical protein